jgi:hypothetical protein
LFKASPLRRNDIALRRDHSPANLPRASERRKTCFLPG